MPSRCSPGAYSSLAQRRLWEVRDSSGGLPEVGIEVHAMVSDPDGGITIERWVWERSNEITVTERVRPVFQCADAVGEGDGRR